MASKKRPVLKRVLAVLMLVIFLAGCGQGDTEEKSTGLNSYKGPVVYRLKWLFNASTAGELWAVEKGLFEKNGLNVIVKEGGAEHDAIEEIELGRAQFGIASADQVLRAVSRGADVLVLAQIFQVNPLQWIYIRDKINITKDNITEMLPRLTIGITYGANDEAIFLALARRLNLDPEKLNLYGITYDYSPFWKGKVDLWPCYKNTQGIFLKEKIERMSKQAGFLNPSDYGIDFVANSLITSKRFAKEHPVLTQSFKRCVLEAWKLALACENKDEIVKILSKYEKNLSKRIISLQIDATKRLVWPDGVQLGRIDKKAWALTEKEMFRQGLIHGHVQVSSLFEGR